ncbi:MAG: GMP synthase subunit A [Sulfolobales archaeon]|nr:GMP synthase subunit A [Sulfolobales archaeon]MCX8185954.1 GMP synthase subunit A [Sulfolobales archaeon]MDW7969211.1 GMP synthase subunit A [Sulfolobales archaeon]
MTVSIGVVYFGGQYNHLIWRRLRELEVDANLFDYFKGDLNLDDFDGLIISGGPQNIPEDIYNLSSIADAILKGNRPILGICLGHQLISYVYGGQIGEGREYGNTLLYVDDEDTILRGVGRKIIVWESHNKAVITPPKDFKILARSDKFMIQALMHVKKHIYSVQFHPEVKHTERGELIFKNFIEVCRG